VESVVRAFAALPKNTVSLTVVCGSSPRMFERVHEVAATAGLAATILGFERDMPRRFAEAHVVVGKAGGLTVSEALTSGRPLVIVGAVPGNEALNEAFVVEGGAGVAVAPDASARTVLALAQLGALETMGLRARGLVRRGAADAVLDCALGLGRPVRGARTSVAGSRVALTA
jgi:processive 1,2-diacylglycerol beta-glucosyltransferase